MYKIKITKTVEDEINYLHNKYPNTEWSGVLALTFSDNDNNIVFETIGIYPMDVGNNISTSFSYKDKIIDIYKYFDKKTSEKYVLGTIHTHHTMSAFISNIDLSEIKNNVNIFNNYLFLVVDNKKTYVAKFARRKIIEVKSEYFLDFNNNKKYSTNSESKITDVEIFDVEIEYPKNVISKEFKQLVLNINLANKIKSTTVFKPEYNNMFTYDTFKTNSNFKNFLENNETIKLNNNQKALMLFLSSSLDEIIDAEDGMYSIMEYYDFIDNCIEINTDFSNATVDSLKDKIINAYNESIIFYNNSLSINEWINNIINEINEILSNSRLNEYELINKKTIKVLKHLNKLLTTLKTDMYEY